MHLRLIGQVRSFSTAVPGGLWKALGQNVTKRTSSPQDLLTLKYEPFPDPINNCATLYPTREIFSDPSHPLHHKALRVHQDFDPKKLHWRVQCPVDVSNSGFIRNKTARRVRNAVVRKLKERGWREDGSVVEGQQGHDKRSDGLSGALLVILNKKRDITLAASKEDVEQSAGRLLDRVIQLHQEAQTKQRRTLQPSRRASSGGELSRPQNGQERKAQRARETSQRTGDERGASRFDPTAARQQVEYYFSEANLPFDAFLLDLSGGSENKAVGLKQICVFKKMRAFKPYPAIVDAVRQSSEIYLVDLGDGQGEGVKRRVPLDTARWTQDAQENRRRVQAVTSDCEAGRA